MRQALLTVLLAAVALAAGGCGGGKSAATTTVTTVSTVTNVGGASVTTHGRFHYPPTLIDNFMRSCTKGDTAKQAYCGCALDKLSNNVSTRDFTRIGLSGGKVPPRIRRLIRQATRACRTGRS